MGTGRELLSEDAKTFWQDDAKGPCGKAGEETFGKFQDNYRKFVTSVLLENERNFLREDSLNGVAGTGLGTIGGNSPSATQGIDAFDPVLISLVRRAVPNLMAFDIAGVQPLNGPTGLIFALKSRYGTPNASGYRTGNEALFNEAINQSGDASKPAYGNMDDIFAGDMGNSSTAFEAGRPMPTTTAERLGQSGGTQWGEMTFTIEKTNVEVGSRALKAEYTTELQQDLKAVHGLDAEGELSNILSTEIMQEINRELVRTIYDVAMLGCQQQDLASYSTPVFGTRGGVYNLEVDSDGRWAAEKFRGLVFQLERECNTIGGLTRRGKGNIAIVSPDVASALSMSGLLDFSPVFSGALNTDVNSGTFAGVLHGGRIKVYIDPFSIPTHTEDWSPINYICVGYKGATPYDAGLFYCPYVPLQMMRAVDQSTMNPKIGFKTRYGMVSNPFVIGHAGLPDGKNLTRRKNQYYRIFRVDNLHGNDASYGG